METALQVLSVIAGMGISLAFALLVEELIFGEVLRMFARRQAAAQRAPRP